MSTPTTVNVTSLLTDLGFGPARPDNAAGDVELVIETFDSWQNSPISLDGPVMGCMCFRESGEELVAA